MTRWLPLAILGIVAAVACGLRLCVPMPPPGAKDAADPEAAAEPAVAAAPAPAGPPVRSAAGFDVVAPGLRLRLRDAMGAPAQGARIAVLDLGRESAPLLGVFEADAAGLADLGPWTAQRAAGAHLVVAHFGHAPALVPAEREPGVQDIALIQDLSVAGLLRVDGAPPGDRLAVDVRGFRDPADAWPAPARAILHQWGLGDLAAVAWADADGRFALRGLPAGEVVELGFPRGFVLAGEEPPRHPAARTVLTPALDLVVDLARLPTIRGRLERSADPAHLGVDGLPILPDSWLSLEWTLEAGDGSESDASPVGFGQSFTIPIVRAQLDRAELRVRDGAGRLLGRRVLPGPLAGGADLGLWVVPDAEIVLQILVVDERGAPVPDAIVVVHAAVQGRSAADGRLRIVLHAAPGSLTVGAFGHRLRRLPLPEPIPAELTVRLEPASRLRVEVRTPDGAPAPEVVAVLSYSGGLPADAPEALAGFEEVRGPPAGGGIWSQGWREHHYPLTQGIGEWSDLPADEEFTLQIRDRYDTPLHEERLRLASAERRALLVALPRAGRTLSGRVTTPQGAPLAGASAWIGGLFQEAVTDADGRVSFPSFYGETPDLWLSAEGRVARQVPAAEIGAGSWELEPARSLWVRTVNARGERVAAGLGPLLELDGGWKGAGAERGPGLYEVPGVPLRAGIVTIPQTEAAPVPISADQTEVMITLPDA